MDARERKRIRKKIIDGTIYKEKRYVRWRNRIYKRDRYVCQLCEKAGGSLQAHHIVPKYKYPSKIYNIDNGITLCYGCHQEVHAKDWVKKLAAKFKRAAKKNKPKPRMIKVRRAIKCQE